MKLRFDFGCKFNYFYKVMRSKLGPIKPRSILARVSPTKCLTFEEAKKSTKRL